jgi:hypothetical protein
VRLSHKVSAPAWTYFGGLGMAFEVTSDLLTGLGCGLTDSISTRFEYRSVIVDSDKDDFLYSVRQEGIATDITFAF